MLGILLSSGISLILYILEVSKAKTKAEEEQRKAIANAQMLKNILDQAQTTVEQQKINLERTKQLQSGLEETSTNQKANLEKTNAIAQDMRTSITAQESILKGNEKISGDMGLAVKSINETSRTTNTILTENVERVDSLFLEVVLEANPLAFKDSAGRSILSANSLELLEAHRFGRLGDSGGEWFTPIGYELRKNYFLVKNSVLSRWFFTSRLYNPGVDPNKPLTEYTQGGDSNVTSFGTSPRAFKLGADYKQFDGYTPVTCFINYSIPPDRYAGFRKYKDFNGIKWAISMEVTDTDVIPVEARLYIGNRELFSSKVLTISKFHNVVEKNVIKYFGEVKIPDDFF